MPSKRKFYRTLIEVEVLSEEAVDFGDLAAVHYAITDGDCSGQWGITKSEPVSGPKMAKLLKKQGSDPEFFQLDDHGEDVDD